MAREQVVGVCRICGQSKLLTEEHIIPRVAGGDAKIKLYNGNELLKTLNTSQKPYGRIRQNGHTEYSLCGDCNSYSGGVYDTDFADFFNTITQQLPPNVAVPKGVDAADYLENKKINVTVMDIKPLNIAKRILVSFCSVEHPGLTDRKPEIRKAILDKDYRPDTDDFSIFLSLHVGNPLYFGTQAVQLNAFSNPISEAYAGIETDVLAFYISGHDEHLKGGNLIKCLDITSWLTRYEYNEVANVQLELAFNKSLSIRFPIPVGK
jgi:hypothetical protein